MRQSVRQVSTIVILMTSIACIMGAIGAEACSGADRQKTIQATLSATNAAGSAFETYDQQHQAAIIATAKDKQSGTAELQAWRINQNELLMLFSAAYQAIAAAAVANDDQSISAMVQAALHLSQALKDAGVTK